MLVLNSIYLFSITADCKDLADMDSTANLTANQTTRENFTSAATEFWE